MHTQISKWGNSLAVRLPKSLTDELDLGNGSNVDLTIEQGRIVIALTKPKYRLQGLLDGITEDNIPESFDDGPQGKELI